MKKSDDCKLRSVYKKIAFSFILTDLVYLMPVIKQWRLLENDLKIWSITYEICILILMVWAYNSKWDPFRYTIPYDIPQKVYWLWKRCAQVYFIAILIHALCYFFMDSVPWGVWWLVTISFAIYLSFQIGYGIKRIVEMKFMD